MTEYADQLEALRQRRRDRAAQLRAEGLSTRAIAHRIGCTHPTVLSDLKVEQLSREDLAGMTSRQIEAARQAGKLTSIMDGEGQA